MIGRHLCIDNAGAFTFLPTISLFSNGSRALEPMEVVVCVAPAVVVWSVGEIADSAALLRWHSRNVGLRATLVRACALKCELVSLLLLGVICG